MQNAIKPADHRHRYNDLTVFMGLVYARQLVRNRPDQSRFFIDIGRQTHVCASCDDYIARLRESVANDNRVSGLDYSLDFSLGYTRYRSKETYKEFLNRMDANMYIEKNRKKGFMPESC